MSINAHTPDEVFDTRPGPGDDTRPGPGDDAGTGAGDVTPAQNGRPCALLRGCRRACRSLIEFEVVPAERVLDIADQLSRRSRVGLGPSPVALAKIDKGAAHQRRCARPLYDCLVI